MKLVAFDTETHLIQPGLSAPPLVCGSIAYNTPDSERLLSKDDARKAFKDLLADPTVTLGGASIDYDFGVMSADDPSNVAGIFAALEAGRVVDTKCLEKLHEIATTGLEEYGDHHLATLEQRYLGIDRSAEKEEGNGWRLSYALLDDVPIDEWPTEAVQYPRADARGTHSVLLKQLTPGLRQHEGIGLSADQKCYYCGGRDSSLPCVPIPRYNLQCVPQELQAAWTLRLASIWGMRTDSLMVPEVVAEIIEEHQRSRALFFGHGIVRVRACTKKAGEYERADDISLNLLEVFQDAILEHEGEPWVAERLEDIAKARAALAKGRPIRFAEDKSRLKALVEEAYHGDPPLTDGGASGNRQTSTSRDTLEESGNALLEEYGAAGSNEKLLSTYVDVLQQGVRVPICPEANSLVSTQRTSYRKPNLQQLPRKGRIRETFVPRGYVYEDV